MMKTEEEFPYPLASTEWLAVEIGAPDLKIIDASWRMPGEQPAIVDHVKRRIDGAVFFDIDAVADKSTPLPHMLPPPDEFSRAVGALGVTERDRVIVYDDAGLFSAARVWWTFRAMGHERVSVLDGGLPKWMREGRPLASGGAAPRAVSYRARARPIARTSDDIRKALEDGSTVILDARPAPRFSGEAKEPRPGLRSGHMPGAKSLPYSLLLTENGEMRPLHELAALFRGRGVHFDTPVIASCGSGVTAAVIALALERLGHTNHAVYDGSWAEWGDQSNDPGRFPVVAG